MLAHLLTSGHTELSSQEILSRPASDLNLGPVTVVHIAVRYAFCMSQVMVTFKPLETCDGQCDTDGIPGDDRRISDQ